MQFLIMHATMISTQAHILSLLPDQRLIMTSPTAAGGGDDTGGAPYRAIQVLGALMDWFRSVFSAMAAPGSGLGGDNGLDEFRPPPPLAEQTRSALRLRAGHAELLVTLFVSLVRSMGMPVRYVQLLDVIPLEPWKRRKLSVGKPSTVSLEAARQREEVRLTKLKRTIVPEQQTPAVTLPKTASHTIKPPEANVNEDSRKSKKGKAAGKGSKTDRLQPGLSSEGPSISSPQCDNASVQKNRGEEEFEREMQLAMMATAAEAEARQASRASSSSKTASTSGMLVCVCQGVRGEITILHIFWVMKYNYIKRSVSVICFFCCFPLDHHPHLCPNAFFSRKLEGFPFRQAGPR